ncbi:MAG: galactokinase [Candidatus Omnitrophota bacterium]
MTISSNTNRFTVYAPGRVNLLGEHTDYNGLPVLPMAIDRRIRVYGAPRMDAMVAASREDIPQESVEFALRSPIPKHPQGHWINYVKAGMQGVLDSLTQSETQEIRGCDLMVSGTIPQGVGLSSSSALVVASALALLKANRIDRPPIALAEQMAEAEHYTGTRGGGMDQAACLLSRAGHLLKIDFFPLRAAPVSLPDGVTVVICDSLIRAKKSETALKAYNLRALECRFAVLLLRRFLHRKGDPADFQRLGDLLLPPWNLGYPELARLAEEALKDSYGYSELCSALGDEEAIRSLLLDYSFDDDGENLSFACGKRFRHVIRDAQRVELGKRLLQERNVRGFGRLMNEGHDSARNDFEISRPELDRLTEAAREQGALGSRLTGAGFGGCTVNLVYSDEAERFRQAMYESCYAMTQPKPPIEETVLNTDPADGAQVVNESSIC